MSYGLREASGKDKSIFVTKEDLVKTELVKELVEEDSYGIVLPSGEINWDCPCLGDLPQGSCGEEFKTAFSCFHYSEEEEKGIDCIPHFQAMQECFQKYPEEYSKYADDEEEDSIQGSDAGGEAPVPAAADHGKSPSPASSPEESSSPSISSNEHSQETLQSNTKSESEHHLESISSSKLVPNQVPAAS